MIFAKVDVGLPRHYRLLDVRAESVWSPLGCDGGFQTESDRTRLDNAARIARAAALGVWTVALCYTREHMLDGFCPLGALREFAPDEVVEELVVQGLFARSERDGRPGVVVVNYAKHNETKADIERRMKADRERKISDRIPRGRALRAPRGIQPDSDWIPRSESESESESDQRRSPSQAPGAEVPRGNEHQELVAHFAAEFERLKGVKPMIGARGGAGAKKLLRGRTLAEAKAIVDRALADPWWLERNPDLGAIAGKINAFIGRPSARGGRAQPMLQPTGGTWKKADGAHE